MCTVQYMYLILYEELRVEREPQRHDHYWSVTPISTPSAPAPPPTTAIASEDPAFVLVVRISSCLRRELSSDEQTRVDKSTTLVGRSRLAPLTPSPVNEKAHGAVQLELRSYLQIQALAEARQGIRT